MSIDTRETSSSDIFIPPGLYLPGPDEDVEKYARERFNHSRHDFEDVVDFAAFVTALNVLASPETGRESVMPTQRDFLTVLKAGYGITKNRIADDYGGEVRIQAALGFHPADYDPTESDITDRLKWMSAIFPYESMPNGEPLTVNGIITWASRRHLLPSYNKLARILGEAPGGLIHRIFGIHRPNIRRDYKARDTFKFGQKIVDRTGGLVIQHQLSEFNEGEFLCEPYSVIATNHGTLSKFWAEFGLFGRTRELSTEDLLTIGVKQTINNNGKTLNANTVRSLSTQNTSISDKPFVNRFGSYRDFRAEVARRYEKFAKVLGTLEEQGVCEEMRAAVGNAYRPGEEYETEVLSSVATLQALSVDTDATTYIRRLILRGFDLRHDDIYKMQVTDLAKSLYGLKLGSKSTVRFVVSLIPRVSIEDTIEDMRLGRQGSLGV